MSNTQTEAQRLADWADDRAFSDAAYCNSEYNAIADELRRLDAENQQLRAQLSKAVAEEREACAKVCEYQADRFMQASPLEGNKPYASHECAAAIRARSNT